MEPQSKCYSYTQLAAACGCLSTIVALLSPTTLSAQVAALAETLARAPINV